MSDEIPFYAPNAPQAPPRQAKDRDQIADRLARETRARVAESRNLVEASKRKLKGLAVQRAEAEPTFIEKSGA